MIRRRLPASSTERCLREALTSLRHQDRRTGPRSSYARTWCPHKSDPARLQRKLQQSSGAVGDDVRTWRRKILYTIRCSLAVASASHLIPKLHGCCLDEDGAGGGRSKSVGVGGDVGDGGSDTSIAWACAGVGEGASEGAGVTNLNARRRCRDAARGRWSGRTSTDENDLSGRVARQRSFTGNILRR